MRKYAILLALAALICSLSWAQHRRLPALTDTAGRTIAIQPGNTGVAFIFLSPECPLCKNYGPVLQEISRTYPSVKYYGILPGKSYTNTDIATYTAKYLPAFPILIDKDMKLVKQLNATTTPEVVLLDKQGNVYYRGLIDNWVTGLGKKRARATELYFTNALSSLVAGSLTRPAFTSPIGCLINEY